MPPTVRLNPIDAEVIGADYLFRILPELKGLNSPWGQRLQEYAFRNLLVLRPILISLSKYAKHLRRLSDWNGDRFREELLQQIETLPEMPVWMVELSIPELFSTNRRKVGEVLLCADRRPGKTRDFSNYFFARIPGYFVFRTGGDVGNPQFSFVPSGIQGHVALFDCEGFPHVANT